MTNDIIFDYDKCRTDIFENGEFVVALDIPKIQANALCVALTERSDSYDFDWQYSGGRVCVRQLRRKGDGISSQWISVDERLPGKYASVLVRYHAHYDDESITEFDVCAAFFDGETFDPKDQLFYQKRNTTVTHWMPLPELPNNETKGDRHDS